MAQVKETLYQALVAWYDVSFTRVQRLLSRTSPHGAAWVLTLALGALQVKETSYQARMASKRRGEEAVQKMQAELDALRAQKEVDKAAADAKQTPSGRPGSGYIATPGLRADEGQTPRRTPARMGL